jgi:SHS2 domain-containing protein
MPTDEKILAIENAIKKRSGGGGLAQWNTPSIVHTLTNSSPSEPEGFEYLDHTADVQLHAWGDSFLNALEMTVLSMFGYMTNLNLVKDDHDLSQNIAKMIKAQGHDKESLVFEFLDGWLFLFHDEGFVPNHVTINSFNLDTFTITSSATGEKFDAKKHTKGTEVKAITYSNMHIEETKNRCDIWVIIDI